LFPPFTQPLFLAPISNTLFAALRQAKIAVYNLDEFVKLPKHKTEGTDE
jgi:hypothetical protein